MHAKAPRLVMIVDTMCIALKSRRIELVSVCMSVVLSIWLINLDSVINDDGVLYLKSAEALAQRDWKGAVDIYQWPFYAMLIAIVHQFTSLDFDVSAYLLSTIFYAALVWIFLTIVRALGAGPRALWLAAIFILVLPSLNLHRNAVIRDVGFWMLYLAGILAMLRFQYEPKLRRALIWGGAMVVATMFRIEGLFFLLLLPIVVLWRPTLGYRAAVIQFAQLQAITVIGVMAMLWLGVLNKGAYSGRLLEPLGWLRLAGEQLSGGILERVEAMQIHVLQGYSGAVAIWAVMALMVILLAAYIVSGMGLLGIFASAYACYKKAIPFSQVARRLLITTFFLNLVLLVFFIIAQFFMGSRYIMPLVLTMGLVVPFGLDHMYERWRTQQNNQARREWLFPAAAVLLLIMTVDSLWSFGPSKLYLKEAGLWLRSDTPAEAHVYSANTVVGFYAHKNGDEWKRSQPPLSQLLQDDALHRYDYVVLTLKKNEVAPEPFLRAQPIKVFSNKKNDRVLIYGADDIHVAPAPG